jgi:predicted amidohydrolase YtcJ
MRRSALEKNVSRGLTPGRLTSSERHPFPCESHWHLITVNSRLGGRVALGSDFPVESIDPLKGFFAAISRTNEKGESPHGPDGWYPEQKLTREQALRGFTIDCTL